MLLILLCCPAQNMIKQCNHSPRVTDRIFWFIFLLTVDTDGEVCAESCLGGDGSIGHVTPEYRSVVLLPWDDLQLADGLAVPAVGQSGVAGQVSSVRESEPGDLRRRRASPAGAGEAVGLALHRLHAGLGDGWRSGGEEDRQADGDGVELHPGPVLLHPTLELAVVPVVVCVRYVQVVPSLSRAGLHPAVITVRTK